MPLYSKAITVSYYNYYLKKSCVMDLTYTLKKGFTSLNEAKEMVSKNGILNILHTFWSISKFTLLLWN